MKLYSWNINGLRAACRNGFLEWFNMAQPDVLCLQETKADPDLIEPALRTPRGYSSAWLPAKRPGYSGVATYFRKCYAPMNMQPLGIEAFDREGRVQVLEYPGFCLVNAYFPNSQPERRRLEYKLAFFKAVRRLCNRLRRAGKDVVICGDFNVAHKEIDLARPKENRNNPGFYPEECAAMDRFIRAGYVDTFRHFHPGEPGCYSWWSYRTKARVRNVGWRLDYFLVNKEFLPRVVRAVILSEVMGADHCPVSVTVAEK